MPNYKKIAEQMAERGMSNIEVGISKESKYTLMALVSLDKYIEAIGMLRWASRLFNQLRLQGDLEQNLDEALRLLEDHGPKIPEDTR